MKYEKCWSPQELKWLPTSDVTFQLLFGDKEIEEVEYAEIETHLPPEAKPRDPWENY